eukprot:365730-Chlamydomonas_euryale.AAC.5
MPPPRATCTHKPKPPTPNAHLHHQHAHQRARVRQRLAVRVQAEVVRYPAARAGKKAAHTCIERPPDTTLHMPFSAVLGR